MDAQNTVSERNFLVYVPRNRPQGIIPASLVGRMKNLYCWALLGAIEGVAPSISGFSLITLNFRFIWKMRANSDPPAKKFQERRLKLRRRKLVGNFPSYRPRMSGMRPAGGLAALSVGIVLQKKTLYFAVFPTRLRYLYFWGCSK